MAEKERTPRAARTGKPMEVKPDGSIKIKDTRRAKIELPDLKGDHGHLTQQMVQKYRQLGYEIDGTDGFTITMSCSLENVRRIQQENDMKTLRASSLVHTERNSPTLEEKREGADFATVQKLDPANISDFASEIQKYNSDKETEISRLLDPHVKEIAARMFDMED